MERDVAVTMKETANVAQKSIGSLRCIADSQDFIVQDADQLSHSQNGCDSADSG